MGRTVALVAGLFLPISLMGCGGSPPPQKPVETKAKAEPPAPKQETEEERASKRLKQAHAIIAEGTTCLPADLKSGSTTRLELAAVGPSAIVCAVDGERERLLGPLACWKVDLASGELSYQQPAPLPGRSLSVKLEDRCARGYCLPNTVKAPDDGVVHLAWNGDGSKVALLASDDVHLFAADTRMHEKGFSIRGEKGVTNNAVAVHWSGDGLFIEGSEGPEGGVWAFKLDGSPVGPIEAIGSKDGKPISTFGGSFSLLDKNRVAVAEQGFSTLTIYEIESGKRSKLVRKLTKPPCKADELGAWWKREGDVGGKCNEHMSKSFGHLIGATAVAGATNFLVMLRGPRLGELAVLDAKTLAEKKVIKLPWCPADGATMGAEEADALKTKKDEPDAKPVESAPGAKRGAVKKAEDPDAGGE